MKSYRHFVLKFVLGDWLNNIILLLAIYALFSTPLLILRLVTNWSPKIQVASSLVFLVGVLYIIKLFAPGIKSFLLNITDALKKTPIWCIVFLGFVLRLTWVLVFPAQPSADGAVYLTLAENIENGFPYQMAGDKAYWPVGYPAFLSIWLSFIDDRQVAYLLSSFVLYLITIVGILKLTNYLTENKGGKIAALTFAIWPNLIFIIATPQKEMVILALLPWATLFMVKVCDERQSKWAFFAGLLLGCAMLVQPSLQLLPIVGSILLFVVLGLNRSSFLKSFLLILGAVLVVAPWTFRNYQQFDSFVLVSTNGGDVFYRANNPLATGGYIEKGEINLGYIDKEETINSEMDEVERDNLGKKLAFEWIASNPLDFITLIFEKQVRFMGDDSVGVYATLKRGKVSENVKLYALLKVGSNAWWIIIWGVIASLVLVARNNKSSPNLIYIPLWLWLYLFVIHSVFESTGKYHVPMLWVPCILISLLLHEKRK